MGTVTWASVVKSSVGKFKGQLRRWYAGAIVLLAILIQLLSLHVMKSQLHRREQALDRASKQLHDIVQTTEGLARRIEKDLLQQRQMMELLQVNLPKAEVVSAGYESPVELPIEPAPSPVPSLDHDPE
jgi:hypothetical protein